MCVVFRMLELLPVQWVEWVHLKGSVGNARAGGAPVRAGAIKKRPAEIALAASPAVL